MYEVVYYETDIQLFFRRARQLRTQSTKELNYINKVLMMALNILLICRLRIATRSM